MNKSRSWREWVFSDVGILILLAAAKLLFHALTNTQYGFHRDELQNLDDARYLAWGYVQYPPLTAAITRIALTLFGPSLDGLRFIDALAQSIAMVFAGLTARELGGKRFAQVLAALAVAIAPISFAMSTLFEYVGFDYLWGVLLTFLLAKLLNTANPRWWLAIGAVIGLGMMTRYTIAFAVVGLAAGVLLTPARRYLASPWLWGGAALSLLIVLPNLIWQAQHNLISLEFLSSIHARDIAIGRTNDFWIDQLLVSTNPVLLPVWLAGLYFYFFAANGKRFRLLGWMALVSIVLFWIAQARGYYTGPLYPMLFAAGAVWLEQWIGGLSPGRARVAKGITWALVLIGGVVVVALGPYAPINSGLWKVANDINGDLREEVGWPELTQAVAGIYNGLPAETRAHTAILAGNYGAAGAIDLYGAAYGLPNVISPVNSYWLRGYGDPPPQTVIVVGLPRQSVDRAFSDCDVAWHVTNTYGVKNEETTEHPDIFLCRGTNMPWALLWERMRSFG